MFWSFSWETMGHLYLIYPNWIHFAGGVWNQQPVMIFRQWAQFKKQTYGTPEKCFLYIVFHVVQAHFFKPHVFVHLFPIKYLDFLHRLPQGPSATLTCSASAWIGDSDFKFLIVKTVKIFLMGNQVTNTAEFHPFFRSARDSDWKHGMCQQFRPYHRWQCHIGIILGYIGQVHNLPNDS